MGDDAENGGQPVVEEVKDEPKPKEFTREEKDNYHKFVEDINNFFAEIILR